MSEAICPASPFGRPCAGGRHYCCTLTATPTDQPEIHCGGEEVCDG